MLIALAALVPSFEAMPNILPIDGEVHRAWDTFVATPFVKVLGLPILPVGPARVYQGHSGNPPRAVASAGLRAVSVLRAYGWVWPVLGFASLLLVRTVGPSWALAASVVCMIGIFVTSSAGRLDERGLLLRRVYAEALGFAADPRELVSGPWEGRLVEYVQRRAAELSGDGYRQSSATWDTVALDLAVTDRAFLVAALTLARRRSAPDAMPVRTTTTMSQAALEHALHVRLDLTERPAPPRVRPPPAPMPWEHQLILAIGGLVALACLVAAVVLVVRVVVWWHSIPPFGFSVS